MSTPEEMLIEWHKMSASMYLNRYEGVSDWITFCDLGWLEF